MENSDRAELLKSKFERASQGQVFKFFDKLDGAAKNSFLSRLESVDLKELGELVGSLVLGDKAKLSTNFGELKPAPFEPLPKDKDSDPKWLEAKRVGEEAIKRGELAAFVVAGGQGTRLGFNAPKGLFQVSPVKAKPLFQIFAEKILRAQNKYGVQIPWLIMTSHINDSATREFFEKNSFFGLKPENVIFFKQGLMPAVDKNGRIILANKGEIAMTPDGHGGCLRAMVRSGAVERLKAMGVKYLSYFQVDNPLVDIIDPYFLGFHILGESQMSSKMIPKAYAGEKVGHFCLRGGKLCVIEYSDLPEDLKQKRNADGSLTFIAGSVAIHILDVDFIAALGSGTSGEKLPFHRADKKIPYVDDSGNIVKPDAPNGIKFEMFVFDALEFAKNPVIIEGARRDEFSPVKNAEGVDSPKTCREDQKKQFAYWLREAGVDLATDERGVPVLNIEISPLFATNKADFVAKWKALSPEPKLCENFYLE